MNTIPPVAIAAIQSPLKVPVGTVKRMDIPPEITSDSFKILGNAGRSRLTLHDCTTVSVCGMRRRDRYIQAKLISAKQRPPQKPIANIHQRMPDNALPEGPPTPADPSNRTATSTRRALPSTLSQPTASSIQAHLDAVKRWCSVK